MIKTAKKLTAIGKALFAALFALTMLFGFASCGTRYTSSYSALVMTTKNLKGHCEATFQRLNGTYVFKTKKSSNGEGSIEYAASLEEGELNVYYDIYGTKELLFTIKAGEEIENVGGYVESGKTVYIIVETVEPSRGAVRFEL